jgi:hypothetical protein
MNSGFEREDGDGSDALGPARPVPVGPRRDPAETRRIGLPRLDGTPDPISAYPEELAELVLVRSCRYDGRLRMNP